MASIPGYKILKKIGEGGMSTVYLAIQLSVGREVALKIMSAEMSADEKYTNLFYREANIIGTLSHPNIVSVYDVGTHNNFNYIAMDYLSGASFREKINAGLTLQQSLKILRELASALNHIHQQGYVHLDLKPDNILFKDDSTPVILDFGIAVTQNYAAKVTDEASVAGTPQYMSPEQAQGRVVDGRSDLYSLGVVLHEMLTQEVPYKDRDPVKVAVKHLTSAIPSLPIQHKVAQPLINKLLAKKPESRFQTGEEVVQATYILEASLNKNESLLTHSDPTAMQAYSLLEALLSTLGAVILIILKRFAGRFEIIKRVHFSARHGLIIIDKEKENLFINDGLTPNASMEVDTQRFDNKVADAIANQTAKKVAPPYAVWLLIISLCSLLLIVTGLGSYLLLTDDVTSAKKTVQSHQQARPKLPQTETTKQPEQDQLLESLVTPSPEKQQQRYKLSIATSPSKAKITLLNHPAEYVSGILLPPGNYQVEISHPDYFSQTRSITVANSPVNLNVNLTKREKAYAVGEVFTDQLRNNIPAPSMVVVPAGSFLMGASNTSTNRNAQPAHKVTIAKPFAISIHEITWGQYRHYAKSTRITLHKSITARSDSHPVTNITWEEARNYAQWLSDVTGKNYRLPSEAEWEYAARGNTTGPYWWDEQNAKNKANCKKGCLTSWSSSTLFSTVQVGRYKANPFGLFDTSGNAAEWVADCYHKDFTGAPSDGSAWVTPNCYNRVIRGGSYQDSDNRITNDYRSKAFAKSRRPEIGFRVLVEQ